MNARAGSAAPAGLTAAQVAASRERYGRNELPAPRPRSSFERLLGLLREPMTLLLLVAAVATVAVLGDVAEGVAILLILVVNGVVQTVQERRADAAVRALRDLTAPTARVRRATGDAVIAAADLVPGDVVLLAAGDRVPADLVLVDVAGLEVDEAPLTGEPFPAQKRAGDAAEGASYGDRDTEAFAGTLVARGRAAGIVRATGARTAVGAIGGALTAAPVTPLERQMRTLAQRLAVVAITVGVVLVPVAAFRADGERALLDAVLAGAALAIAALPQGMVAVVATALAVGAQRMARGGAIVRRLAALDALGSASVLCVDKTGTLTTGRLSVVDAVVAPGRDEALWDAAVRCSDETGDPVDAALRDRAGPRDVPVRTAEQSFSSEARYMAVWDAQGIAVKGAPEVVLARCRAEPGRDALARAAADLAGAGRRVLAVADGAPDAFEHAELRALGVVAFADPLRESTAPAVAECRRAGLRLVLVTGDHAATATAVAHEAGVATGSVVTGASLPRTSSDDRSRVLAAADVVARVDPSVKLDLVRAHRAAGAIVAMTGDGVNDAPALRHADVGVAVAGEGGTDVAREAADLVVTDGDLGTIVRAVAEGRRIHRNLVAAVSYLVTGNLSEILVVAGGLLLLPELAVPLLPIQLLWLNLGTDGLPALALAVDRPPGDPLAQPPRTARDTLLARRALGGILARAAAVAAVVLGAGALAHRWRWTPEQVRTQLLVTLVPCHLMLAYVARAGRRMFERGWARNRLLLAAVSGSIAAQVALVIAPPLRHAFHLSALPGAGWLLAAAATALFVAATEVARRSRTGGSS